MRQPIEKWTDIDFLEIDYSDSYMVSSLGNIKSKDRFITYSSGIVRFHPSKNLKPKKENNGYLRVALSKGSKCQLTSVHRLVALAFIENQDPVIKNQVNHKDGNKENNTVTNLEWVSSQENHLHSQNVLGNVYGNKGEEHPSCKFNEDTIIEIFIRYRDENISQMKLSKEYGVSFQHIHQIVRKKRWQHVTEKL